MRKSRRERGESQFGCLIGLILLGLAIFVAWKMIPVKVKAAELRQTVVDEANRPARTTMTASERRSWPRRGKTTCLSPKTTSTSSAATARSPSRSTYTIPIVFPGYTYNWHLMHEARNPIF